jgi:hypothetical protein
MQPLTDYNTQEKSERRQAMNTSLIEQIRTLPYSERLDALQKARAQYLREHPIRSLDELYVVVRGADTFIEELKRETGLVKDGRACAACGRTETELPSGYVLGLDHVYVGGRGWEFRWHCARDGQLVTCP